ncbi:MAG: SpoIVB peptidase S55 domain-containing protein [Pseudomonadota bacterium]
MILSSLLFINFLGALNSDLLPLSEVKKGMKGYGLTVFSGQTPEKFEVEVIDVVRNMSEPDVDMIIVQCTGKNIERSGIASGMSGSPIYLNGKIAGALAIAIIFSKENIGMVTPIEYMLRDAKEDFPRYALGKYKGKEMKHISIPVSISGFSPNSKGLLANELKKYGFEVADSISGKVDIKKEKLVPGSAVGLVMIEGDLSSTAYGTVTYVDGDKVYALGHPAHNLGLIEYPMTNALIHTIIPRYDVSLKVASSGPVIGTFISDRYPGTFGLMNKKADLVPVTIKIKCKARKIDKEYNIRIIRSKFLTPAMFMSAVSHVFDKYSRESNENTVNLKACIKLKGQDPINIEETFYNPSSTLDLSIVKFINDIYTNPFEKIRIEKIDVSAEVWHEKRTAIINSIWTDKKELSPSEEFKLFVKLDIYNSSPQIFSFDMQAPANKLLNAFSIKVLGGNSYVPMILPPKSVADIIKNIPLFKSSTNLIVNTSHVQRGLVHGGYILDNLPESYLHQFASSNKQETAPFISSKKLFKDTDYIIQGERELQLIIK